MNRFARQIAAYFLLLSAFTAEMSPSVLALEFDLGTGPIVLATRARNIDLTLGARYPFLSFLEGGFDLNYQNSSITDTTVSGILLIFGPSFVFGGKNDAFFITLGGAWRKMDGDPDPVATPVAEGQTAEEVVDPNGFGFALLVGKKIPLIGSFSLRPTLGITVIHSLGFYVNPLYVSWQF